MSLIAILTISLVVISVAFAIVWDRALARMQRSLVLPSPIQLAIGFITDFLDTLSIGSFAVTTTLYRLIGIVDDEKIPGTLNVGHCLPTILQALIFINAISIDPLTLVLLIGASVAGALCGAHLVSQLPKRQIQIGLGIAMLIAASLILAKQLGLIPGGGDASSLTGIYLAIAIVGNFLFGALMTIGVGAYAPIMIMVSLLGMNQKAAFPIMMGSCAFLMPVASWKFVQTGKYDPRAALGLALAGLPGVAVAAIIVQELPTYWVNWLVIGVVIYTSITMLMASHQRSKQ